MKRVVTAIIIISIAAILSDALYSERKSRYEKCLNQLGANLTRNSSIDPLRDPSKFIYDACLADERLSPVHKNWENFPLRAMAWPACKIDRIAITPDHCWTERVP